MSVSEARLANGMRIVSDRVDSVGTVSLGVWVGAGTRDETAAGNGLSHLLEHMAFKGTATRSAFDIAAAIEDIGGHLNAYTSRETTVYHATVLKEHLPLAVGLLADILCNSAFDEEELARERRVVLQEIGLAGDAPEDVVSDWFQETAFPGQPLGRPVLGTAETVGGLDRRALLDFVAGRYGAGRMVFAAAGNLDHDRTRALAEAAFAGLPAGPDAAPEPARYAGGDRREARGLEQVHLMLGFEGVSYGDDDFHPAAVLSTALGGGMSSRLFQEAREKRGLVYEIHAFADPYRDTGLFGVCAGAGEDTVAETMDVVCAELARAAGERMAEDELARARTQIKAGVLMSLESTGARAERMARQLHAMGRIVPLEETAARIDAVSADDVRRTAARMLASRPTLAALGPVAPLQGFDAVGRLLGRPTAS